VIFRAKNNLTRKSKGKVRGEKLLKINGMVMSYGSVSECDFLKDFCKIK